MVQPILALQEQRLGCTAQCPICGAVCGGSVACQNEDHRVSAKQRHRAELHMPEVIVNNYCEDMLN